MKFIGGLVLAGVLPMAFGYEWRVGVGKDETTGRKGMGFDPSVIHPSAGDTIAFEFRSGVHSAVQSTYDNPCVGNDGFNSGVHTVADDLAVDAPDLPIVRLLVNDTASLWFFDEAGGLCHQGAVLAVNPTGAQTAAVFKENAAQPPKPRNVSSANPSSTSAANNNDAAQSGTPAANGSGSSANRPSNGALSNGAGRVLLLACAGMTLYASGLLA